MHMLQALGMESGVDVVICILLLCTWCVGAGLITSMSGNYASGDIGVYCQATNAKANLGTFPHVFNCCRSGVPIHLHGHGMDLGCWLPSRPHHCAAAPQEVLPRCKSSNGYLLCQFAGSGCCACQTCTARSGSHLTFSTAGINGRGCASCFAGAEACPDSPRGG